MWQAELINAGGCNVQEESFREAFRVCCYLGGSLFHAKPDRFCISVLSRGCADSLLKWKRDTACLGNPPLSKGNDNKSIPHIFTGDVTAVPLRGLQILSSSHGLTVSPNARPKTESSSPKNCSHLVLWASCSLGCRFECGQTTTSPRFASAILQLGPR